MLKKEQVITSLQDIPQNAVIAIYGCGQGGRAFRRRLRKKRRDVKVLFFLDSFNTGKIDGLKILQPQVLKDEEPACDLICIASIAWYEIKSHLQKMGIDNYKVVCSDLFEKKSKRKRKYSAEVPILLQEEYCELYNSCHEAKYSESLVARFKQFRDVKGQSVLNAIASLGFPVKNKIVVDLGCKYGQSAPVFLMLGAAKFIGFDVVPDYIKDAKKIIQERYPDQCEFFQTEGTMIPLQPETVDFVYMSEVISHINPQYLDMVFLEVSRILKKGGLLYISDSNNLESPGQLSKLIELWERCENETSGSQSKMHHWGNCFHTLRKNLIAERYPELSEENLDFLAHNTSGLFGASLMKEVDLYIKTGELIRRPYRRGICPTHPGKSGVLLEMGFLPIEVELKLRKCGFRSERIFERSMSKKALVFLKNMFREGQRKTVLESFRIIGIKEF
jgi:SAM-dependent methyltransferase